MQDRSSGRQYFRRDTDPQDYVKKIHIPLATRASLSHLMGMDVKRLYIRLMTTDSNRKDTLMTTLASDNHGTGPMAALARAEGWLDHKGRAAWIIAMVLGFIFFWPIGLALLGYMIWKGKMTCSKSRSPVTGPRFSARSSGNSAFDAYRNETLRRLEEEQEAFEQFLDRLRQAKDKSEFDQFMDDRARAANARADDETSPREA